GVHDPTYQGYQILHWAFVALPVIAGLDKFAHLLTNWDTYLAPVIAKKVGAYIVAAWLVGIIINLFLGPNNGDIILRDLGLCLGALALGRLAMTYDHQLERRSGGRTLGTD